MAEESSAHRMSPGADDPCRPDIAPPPATLRTRVERVIEVSLAHDTILYASVLLGIILHLTGLTQITTPAFWIAAAPVLYLLWVFLFLVCSAISTGILLAIAPKPRNFIVTRPGHKARMPLIGAGACYQRWHFLQSLPLIGAHMWGIPFLRWLAMRAYSGKPLCLNAGLLADFPLDPDLTEVGRQTIIGGGAMITAHAVGTRADCMFTYASAPVRIGNSVTIGAGARIEMGCQMGDCSILEPGSVLQAFSIVGPNEVWSGVPARFVRIRTHVDPTCSSSRPTPAAAELTPDTSHPDRPRARTLVDDALGEVRDPDSWDSLDQMAIAAALFAQTRVPVPADKIFRLQTLDDVADWLTGNPSGTTIDSDRSPGDDSPLSLPDNPELLPLLDRQTVSDLLAQRPPDSGVRESRRQTTVVIAASFTADPIAHSIRSWSHPFGIEAKVESAGFNQILSALLDPQSPLVRNRGGVNVVLQAAEDLPEGQERVYVDNLLDALEVSLKDSAGTSRLCLTTLPPPVALVSETRRAAIEDARSVWNSRIRQMSDVDIIDLSQLVETIGTRAAWDQQMHETASCPYSMNVLTECGIEIARAVRRSHRPRAKVLAVDCDNTLWGGIVGEVGVDGIELGSTAGGEHYQELQRWILSQQETGVLVVIVSRNEEQDVWNVFDNHSDMILRREHIVAHRINWLPKSENLRSLADELNLGLDSFVFLDDDPAVRLEVETSVPQVTVVPLTEPSQYTELVRRLWAFDVTEVTEEDRQRTAMMAAEQQRTQSAASSGSFDNYLAGLELRVELREAADSDLPRIAQLTQKTNQFNLSVIRRTTEELHSLSASRIFAVSVSDRFGDYGTVGAAILTAKNGQLRLDTFLLSCRVLGRRVEHAFLSALHRIARDSGTDRLRASVVETPRNTPARQFLSDSGAARVSDSDSEWDLSEPAACPAQIELTVRLAADSALD